jgi:hypothetical protein
LAFHETAGAAVETHRPGSMRPACACKPDPGLAI